MHSVQASVMVNRIAFFFAMTIASSSSTISPQYGASLSPCSDLNRGPHSYQECALPTELHGHIQPIKKVGRGGFEPPKASPADLQSAPFGHLGICPHSSRRWESNPQPSAYKADAQPLSYVGAHDIITHRRYGSRFLPVRHGKVYTSRGICQPPTRRASPIIRSVSPLPRAARAVVPMLPASQR